MILGRFLAAAFLAAATCGAAVAQDARRGAELATPCLQCHGGNGRSQMETIPSLAGQPADFITIQLILLREGLRQAPAGERRSAPPVGKGGERIAIVAATDTALKIRDKLEGQFGSTAEVVGIYDDRLGRRTEAAEVLPI